jgi:aldose sugar dehydrogenase
MMRKIVIVIVLFTLGPAQAAETKPTGEILYQKNCSSCHGIKLQGGNAQSLVDGVWQYGSDRGYVFRNIKFGIAHVGMPSYQATLNDRDINAIIAFLQAAEKTAGVQPPALPTQLETQDYFIKVDILTAALEIPWGIAFINADHLLVTERPGRLRVIRDGKLSDQAIHGTPQVLSEGQGGLLDVAVDPEFHNNGWIYLAYSHALAAPAAQPRSPAMTRIVRGRIKDHNWTDQQLIFEAPHGTYRTTRHHYGCRIAFDPQGYLYFGIGDRGAQEQAQLLDRPNGKIHRMHKDGNIPKDNPFVAKTEALPSIFSYGHRNPQGMSVHPTNGDVWVSEHGPMGGDELNLISQGLNYGWPEITFGVNYNGAIITLDTRKPGMEAPNYYWKPSPAVCGIDFIHGPLFPKWRNRLLVASLKYEDVKLLDIEDDRVIHSQVIFKNYGRVRDVACAPNGAIYIVLNRPGAILRLTPLKQ